MPISLLRELWAAKHDMKCESSLRCDTGGCCESSHVKHSGQGDMTSSLQDDPVVRSLDVFVQRNVNLQLVQFPLRPAHLDQPAPMGMGAVEVEEARIKPKAGLLEVVAMQGGKKAVKMRSVTVAGEVSLGVGVIKGDSFHITPVDKVQQMRPYLSDIPTDERDERGEDGLGAGGGGGGDEDNDIAGYYSQAAVKKKIEASVGVTGQRGQSFILQKRGENMEPFVELTPHQINSMESEQVFTKLGK